MPFLKRVLGEMAPSSMAAATASGFMVEPGSKVSVTARFFSSSARRSADTFGLPAGSDTIERISPLLMSITTAVTEAARYWFMVSCNT